MKKLILTLALLATLITEADSLTNSIATSGSLVWSYPTSYWASVNARLVGVTNPVNIAQITNIYYVVYSAPVFNGTNTAWKLYSMITNPPVLTNPDGSLFHKVPISFTNDTYFAVSVSNYIGVAFFGGPAAVPASPPTSQQNTLTLP